MFFFVAAVLVALAAIFVGLVLLATIQAEKKKPPEPPGTFEGVGFSYLLGGRFFEKVERNQARQADPRTAKGGAVVEAFVVALIAAGVAV
jgi:hypothetical protein